MTRPLRRAHLAAWIALAILLPIVFFAALAVRRPPAPRNPSVDWERLPE